MAWQPYQLSILARHVLMRRHQLDVQIEVRIIALCSRMGLDRHEVWRRIERLAHGQFC